jgi:hypothetical protein
MAPTLASVDGRPAETLGAEGLEVKDLNVGTHRLVLGEGKESRHVEFEAGPVPSLSAHFISATDEGGLIVLANEDNAQVLVNDQPSGEIRGGRFLVNRLPVGEHRVRVLKEGFPEPEAQLVRIIKGRPRQLRFTLLPPPNVEAPRMASLRLEGGPQLANAEVILDQTRLGIVASDGNFFFEKVDPGMHVIELHKDRYKPKPIRKQFEAGETVHLSRSDLTLESSYGKLELDLFPPNAQVEIQERKTVHKAGSPAIDLPEGTYHLLASAPGHDSQFRPFLVEAGKPPTRATFKLLPSNVTHGMDGWETPDAWRKQGEWSVYKGSKPMLYHITPPIGSFIFAWWRQSDGKLDFFGKTRNDRLRWVVNYIDDRNHVLYELFEGSISRKVVVNGRDSRATKIPFPGGTRIDRPTLNVIVEPQRIVTQFRDGENWITIDQWIEASRDFRMGKFGFHPKGDEIFITNFVFRPN